MADLSWFPIEAKDWPRRMRELGLSHADGGVLMLLISDAWEATPPCTVRDTPDEMARILGANWKKGVAVFRTQFTPLADDATRRRCDWLYDLYLRQLEKHLSYKNRGHTGGKAKAAKHGSATAQLEAGLEAQLAPELVAQPEAQVEAEPQAQLQAQLAQSTTEALSCAPQQEHTAKSPATASALAPAGAAPRAVVATNGTSNGTGTLPRATVIARLETMGLPGATWVEPEPPRLTRAELEERRRLLEDAYWAQLAERAEGWLARHPDEAAAMEAAERASLGFSESGELKQWQQTAVRRAMHEAYRELPRANPIPSCETWVAEREAAGLAATGPDG